MSTAEGRTRPGRKVWAAVAVLVVVVAGLLHGYRNTNALTGDRLCGGLVSTAKADAILPGSGRLDAEGDGLADDLWDTVCEVEKSSVVLGSGKGTLTLRVREEDGDAPLKDEAWPELSEESFFSGKVTGGVDKYRGWVLLPEKCWAKQPLMVGVSSSEPISDSEAFAALITDAARAVAAGAACGDLPEEPGTLLPPRSEAARPASDGRVCGLDGFSVRRQVPVDTEVLEAGQRAPADLWSCRVSLGDDSRGPVREDGFMTYTASRDPLLIAAVKKAPGTSKGEAPDGREAEVVERTRVVLPCARGELYLASESGLQYLEARKRHPDLPPRDTYFESFVKSATGAFGCGTSARR
ncbi:hypothetical protein OG298_16110 [Streptomyces sp. NBC_01005]|uniref:hypothetical protein n=1 Tax=unclassified Streptomyces TaxID=2593676 RepID=UPI003866B2FB|nr:hypothetical protein OG298_16110 [Streptomyces sp. NBC_01005]WTC95283.1 hypothetical protein OH736_16115 [Streptomyces sp. NBC_01650]